MQTEIILSGFGGQGALFAGMVLAYAGMGSGQQVTWLPCYGPEMRGGTAHVDVIISPEEIGSPLVPHPDIALVLNNPSFEKYEPLVKERGVLVYNSSLISAPLRRTDISYVAIPASDIAAKLGDVKIANMVGLGALISVTHLLPLATVIQALYEHLLQNKLILLALNELALRQGALDASVIKL